MYNQPYIFAMTEQEAKKVVDIIVGAGDKERAREMMVEFILQFPDYAHIARKMFREKFGEEIVRDNEMAREIIREVIHKVAENYGVDVEKIILFGSRARGDHNEDSDWDVLVVVRQSIDPKKMRDIWGEIHGILGALLMEPFDILIKSRQEFETETDIVNTVSNEAKLEGVEL